MQVQLLVRNVTSKTHVRSSSGSPKLTHSCASVGAFWGGTPRRYRLRVRTLLIVGVGRGPVDGRASRVGAPRAGRGATRILARPSGRAGSSRMIGAWRERLMNSKAP